MIQKLIIRTNTFDTGPKARNVIGQKRYRTVLFIRIILIRDRNEIIKGPRVEMTYDQNNTEG